MRNDYEPWTNYTGTFTTVLDKATLGKVVQMFLSFEKMKLPAIVLSANHWRSVASASSFAGTGNVRNFTPGSVCYPCL